MTTRTSPISAAEHFDVLVVGAGLSGIGAGYHLQRHEYVCRLLNPNYALDLMNLRFAAVDDGVMRFSSPAAR